MTTLTAPDDLRAPIAPVGSGGRLRVQRAGSAEKVYPLGVGKWTIGSSGRCHIQLPAAESRPIHCLVALDAGAATATRWAAGVLLNGREFAKQDLQQGDRLTIGAWELRWEADDFDKVVELVERELPGLSEAPAESAVAPAAVETEFPAVATSVETAPRKPAIRPAAKTVLVSSRKTDPFYNLLGPSSPAAATPVNPAAAHLPVEAVAAAPHASLAFQDRLVLDLWAANFAARKRAKSLASRVRQARERADELAAAAAELETKIAASRSAAEAQSAEQTSQIDALGDQLERAIAERDGVAAELEALRMAPPRPAPADPRLQLMADACEQAEANSLRLREQLFAGDRQIVALQTQITEAEVEREQLKTQAAEQKTQFETLDEKLKEALAERDGLASELETLRNAPPRTAPPDPRLQTLADACAVAEAESQRLGEELAASEQSIVALRAEIADAEAARAEVEAHAATQESQIETLAADLKLALAERDNVAAELEALRTARPRTAPPDPRLQTLADACSAAEAETQRLSEQLAASEQTITALQAQISEAEVARAAVDARAADQTSQNEALGERLHRALAERDNAAAEFEALRKAPPDPRLQTLADSCSAAEAEAQRLGELLIGSEQTIAALQAQISEAEFARAAVDGLAADQESQNKALAAELKLAIADRDSAVAELEALRTARSRTAPPDPRLQTLADACAAAETETLRLREQLAASDQQISELESQIAAAEAGCREAEAHSAASMKQQAQWESERDALEQDRWVVAEEVARLSDEMRASELHIERLEEQAAAAEAARAAVEQQLADQQRQQKQWLAECQILQSNHADEVAEITAQRDELQRRLNEQSQASAPATAVWPSYAEQSAVDSESEAAEPPISYANAWAPAVAETAEPTADKPAFDAEYEQDAAEVEEFRPAASTLTHSRESLETAESAEPAAPEKPFTPTSYIDKYKHLLEDEGAPEPSLRQSRPILDDEYLSPKKFPDPIAARDDDSDEALEAYMSNLMRRVRTPGVSPPSSESKLDLGMTRGDEYAGPTASQELEQAESTAAAMPVETDANGMVRTVRKQPAAAANLSALRELANNSARAAIAQHRQRRHTESTVTRGLIFSAAGAAAAYLMLTAPGVDSPWFWGGCVALVAAGGAAAQLISHYWNRFTDVHLPAEAASDSPGPAELAVAVDAAPQA